MPDQPRTETVTERWVHDLDADRRRRGDVFGWPDVGSPTGFWSGIVVDTGPCSVKVRDIRPGILRHGGSHD